MRMIFVNLPVTDVPKARAFHEALGFTINEQFSNEDGICVVVSETIFLMCLTTEKFGGFVSRPVADPATTCAAIVALSCDDRAAVDAMAAAAVGAGGEETGTQDHGFMYLKSFRDPSGNQFEVFWMDPSAVQ